MVFRHHARCLGHAGGLLNPHMTHVQLVACSGFVIGLLFGVAAQRSHYCTASGLREWWNEKSPRRAAALLVALACALVGTQWLAALGWVDIGASLYLQPSFSWLLIPVGGLLFGYGMMRARGCGSRALVLLATGNLRSLVVLLCLGLSAAVTLTGPLAHWRLAISEATALMLPAASLPGILDLQTTGRFIMVAIIAFVLLGGALAFMRLYRHPWEAIGAAVIGLLVPAGWWVTGYLGADVFEPVPVESLTFVAPISDSIQYLMLSTGVRAGFGVTVVGGVLVGACITALITRDFRWRGFDSPQHMLRSISGGVMMGAGGALALGCTIGQGLSGLSTLAIPSVLAVAGIVLGAWIEVRAPWTIPEQRAG